MPRSGSTLLSNILAQNHALHVTGTSGLPSMLWNFYDNWNKDKVIKATENSNKRKTVLKGMFESYHDTGKQYVFNKSRTWLAIIDMVEAFLQKPVRIIVNIRHINGILSSFEKLYQADIRALQSTNADMEYMMIQKSRIEHLMSDRGLIGAAYNSIMNAVHTGHRDKLLPVDYDYFTRNPELCLKTMYDFLEIPAYEHDFNNIKQTIFENDAEFGLMNLHAIRPHIDIRPDDSHAVLGPYANQFQHWDYGFLKQ